MALPTITLSPTSGSAGQVVTITVVRDVPAQPIQITATTSGGSNVAPFNLIQALSLAANPARTFTPVSDDGTTYKATFVA